ncbi:NAD-binding protein [Paracoccus pantotrophus]|uniref:NAD-binding protein n=1 Tax=Paracoccus pantotrophus TaxID=82367 RepID=A0A7H9BNW4_PARPN|nr:NAD(P)-binding domain-containing protein [Paracoccus pantotrophus]QLH13004.1 NAD-binding protein [Paracoccus pantotrophus]
MAKVGYVGLGAMGGSLSRHLVAGYELTVLDRNPAAVEALCHAGARAASNGAELARDCDIIVLCLPRTADVREAIFGAGGLAEGLTPGKLVIDQTSGVPVQTAAIAAELAEQGVAMLDAPVSGGIPAAKAGKVTIIASGPDEAWAQAEPVLRAMTEKVFRCSALVGDAQALKLVNNAIGMDFRMAALELVALGRKAGLGLAPIVERLNAGPAANFTTRNMLAALVEGRSTTDFALALMAKDLNEAMALALPHGAAMPMTAGTRALVQTGLALFGKDAKLDDVIPLTGKLAGVEMRGEGGDDAELLALIETGVLVGNVLSVAECVAMGKRFGIGPAEMARILNVGSAWCAVSDLLLPALAAGTRPDLPLSLGEAVGALTELTRRAAELGTPFILPGFCLALLQEAMRQHGAAASLGHVTFGFEN